MKVFNIQYRYASCISIPGSAVILRPCFFQCHSRLHPRIHSQMIALQKVAIFVSITG